MARKATKGPAVNGKSPPALKTGAAAKQGEPKGASTRRAAPKNVTRQKSAARSSR